MSYSRVISVLSIFILLSFNSYAQHTFSIVAVDTATGEVGSAGASCIDNSLIISDLLPGKGAIHSQALWNNNNQQYAHTLMEKGYTPSQILDSLYASDADGAPEDRQYGIADFDDNDIPRTAGFTGTDNSDYKNHVTGYNYSIQGNILAGQHILDSMENRFLRATGTLAERLMYGLQGGNVAGADTRCLDNNTSSLSSFIRVALPSDTGDIFYLHLNVGSTPDSLEPIDSLQYLFSSINSDCSVMKADFTLSADTINLAETTGKFLITDNSQFVSSRHWDINGVIKTNEEVFFHTHYYTGVYPVTLAVSNMDCKDTLTKNVVMINQTGVNDIFATNDGLVSIYPNPFTSETNISIDNSIVNDVQYFSLFDLLGRELLRLPKLRSSTFTLARNGLSSGVYYYQIILKNNPSLSGKIVIE